MCGGTSQRPVSTAVDLHKCRFLKGLGETLKMCAGGKPYLPKGPSSISFLYWSLYQTVKSTSFFVEDETFLAKRASCYYQYYYTNTSTTQLSVGYLQSGENKHMDTSRVHKIKSGGWHVVSPVWWKSQSHIPSTMLFLDSASTDLLLCAVLHTVIMLNRPLLFPSAEFEASFIW